MLSRPAYAVAELVLQHKRRRRVGLGRYSAKAACQARAAQVESAMAVQSLKPRIDLIKARYGDDKDRVTKETSKLYEEAGVNPLAGVCRQHPSVREPAVTAGHMLARAGRWLNAATASAMWCSSSVSYRLPILCVTRCAMCCV